MSEVDICDFAYPVHIITLLQAIRQPNVRAQSESEGTFQPIPRCACVMKPGVFHSEGVISCLAIANQNCLFVAINTGQLSWEGEPSPGLFKATKTSYFFTESLTIFRRF